jgi:hypothetical protein
MNQRTLPPPSQARLDALQARFALRVTAQLTQQTESLPQDLSERLRFAREQALARAHQARAATATVTAHTGGGTLALQSGPGAENTGRWVKFGSVLPLIALVAGLLLIDHWHGKNQISAAAEIDSALLSDDLPPAAYSDVGFVEYLKTTND